MPVTIQCWSLQKKLQKNYEVIREGKNRDGNQTYMLQLTDKHNNTLMVELSGDGTYWNINTAGIFKVSYGANRREVYNRHTTAKQSAETAEASLSGEQSGTTPSTSMNAPTTSNGKDSKNPSSKQGKDVKVAENQVASGLEKAIERLHDKAVAVPGYTVFKYEPGYYTDGSGALVYGNKTSSTAMPIDDIKPESIAQDIKYSILTPEKRREAESVQEDGSDEAVAGG